MSILVIGSGPSGVFAALGALQQGADVTLIDPGKTLDADTEKLRQKLGAMPHSQWPAEEKEQLLHGRNGERSSLGTKRIFGSRIATSQPQHLQTKGCNLLHSYAQGGLSLLWGRGIEPPYTGEWEHWPDAPALQHALQDALQHIPLAAQHDALEHVFPLYSENAAPHRLTASSQQLWQRWQERQTHLAKRGIHGGASRLALSGCVHCSLCFYGCAYRAMFDATQILEMLQRDYPRFTYRAGLRATALTEQADSVIVTCADAQDESVRLTAERCILAAGAPESTHLMLQHTAHKKATLQQSDLITFAFFAPLSRTRAEQDYHALSQLTLTLKKKPMLRNAAVMHLFGRNPLLTATITRFLPRFLHRITEEKLLTRFYIGMCFLHSADSDPIHVTHTNGITHFHASRQKNSYLRYLRLLGCWLRLARHTGLIPLPFVGGPRPAGSSVHYGASLEVDAQGKVAGSQRIYSGDAAALPEIPAGSYTLMLMANALRIGRYAAQHNVTPPSANAP